MRQIKCDRCGSLVVSTHGFDPSPGSHGRGHDWESIQYLARRSEHGRGQGAADLCSRCLDSLNDFMEGKMVPEVIRKQ